jgi:hypothetical protein
MIMLFFFIETMAISNIQLLIMFCMAATLCEGGGTLEMVVTSKDPLELTRFPQHIFEANHPKMPKVHL